MLSTITSCCLGISQRWTFCIMAFMALWLGNGIRVILSITITDMVIPVHEKLIQLDDTCPIPKSLIQTNATENVTFTSRKIYDWDEYTQGVILSSYFWGYAATQFMFGSLSELFGGKYLLGLSIFLPALLTFITPLIIDYGEAFALIILRVIMGVVSGAMYPAASTMISKWTTPEERARFGSIIFAGGITGTVFGTNMPAIIIKYSGMGWPAVFYFFGALGMVWFPMWIVMCYNNPLEHPYVSEAELKHLQENVEKLKNKNKPPSAPWRHILTSKPFWAFVMALTGVDWAYFTMASDLPKYMSNVVRFPIDHNGYLSSLPYLCSWFNSLFSGWLTDQILTRNWMTLTNTRKFFATISLVGPAIFIVAASYAECNQALVVILFIIGLTLLGSSYPSIMVNTLDMSPNYSGTLMAIGNGIAALGGVFTPYIVGIMTPNQTIGEWRLVFWIVFGVAIISNGYFLMNASAERQEWDDPDFVRDEKQEIAENEKSNKKIDDMECARF